MVEFADVELTACTCLQELHFEALISRLNSSGVRKQGDSFKEEKAIKLLHEHREETGGGGGE